MATDPAGAGNSGLSPHPLVLGLAGRLYGDLDVTEASQLANAARSERYGVGQENAADKTGLTLKDEFLTRFVESRTRSELVILSGYLADSVTGAGATWQLMFLDETAESYVLVRAHEIAFHDRIDRQTAAFGMLDLLWVKADASVLRGDRTESVTARITNGSFVRAGDFRASLTGGTMTGTSELGPLCTATTPCCCKKLSP